MPIAMRGAAAGQRRAQRGVASLEFALVAPILLALTLFGIDCARAFLIWREIHNAALAIADNAAKLSYISSTDSTGKVTADSKLTYDQMQQAMSTIYAEIPALNLGSGIGLFPDFFAVTLSSVEFYPLCATAHTNNAKCGTQTPRLLWSTSLEQTGVAPAPKLLQDIFRLCNSDLTPKPAFADDASQYTTMIDPALAQFKGVDPTLTVPPQIVADVQYRFVPWAPFFFSKSIFYASAAVPAPVGGLDQVTSITGTMQAGNVCTYPPQ